MFSSCKTFSLAIFSVITSIYMESPPELVFSIITDEEQSPVVFAHPNLKHDLGILNWMLGLSDSMLKAGLFDQAVKLLTRLCECRYCFTVSLVEAYIHYKIAQIHYSQCQQLHCSPEQLDLALRHLNKALSTLSDSPTSSKNLSELKCQIFQLVYLVHNKRSLPNGVIVAPSILEAEVALLHRAIDICQTDQKLVFWHHYFTLELIDVLDQMDDSNLIMKILNNRIQRTRIKLKVLGVKGAADSVAREDEVLRTYSMLVDQLASYQLCLAHQYLKTDRIPKARRILNEASTTLHLSTGAQPLRYTHFWYRLLDACCLVQQGTIKNALSQCQEMLADSNRLLFEKLTDPVIALPTYDQWTSWIEFLQAMCYRICGSYEASMLSAKLLNGIEEEETWISGRSAEAKKDEMKRESSGAISRSNPIWSLKSEIAIRGLRKLYLIETLFHFALLRSDFDQVLNLVDRLITYIQQCEVRVFSLIPAIWWYILHSMLGMYSYAIGFVPEAVEHFKLAMELDEHGSSKSQIALHFAHMWLNSDPDNMSEMTDEKLLKFFNIYSIQSQSLIQQIHWKLIKANLYIRQGNFSGAKSVLELASQLNGQVLSLKITAWVITAMVKVALESGNDSAELSTLIQKAIRISATMKDVAQRVEGLNALAKLQSEGKGGIGPDYKASVASLNEAETLLKENWCLRQQQILKQNDKVLRLVQFGII